MHGRRNNTATQGRIQELNEGGVRHNEFFMKGSGAEPQEPKLFTSLASKNPCLAQFRCLQVATEMVICCMMYVAQLHLYYIGYKVLHFMYGKISVKKGLSNNRFQFLGPLPQLLSYVLETNYAYILFVRVNFGARF